LVRGWKNDDEATLGRMLMDDTVAGHMVFGADVKDKAVGEVTRILRQFGLHPATQRLKRALAGTLVDDFRRSGELGAILDLLGGDPVAFDPGLPAYHVARFAEADALTGNWRVFGALDEDYGSLEGELEPRGGNATDLPRERLQRISRSLNEG